MNRNANYFNFTLGYHLWHRDLRNDDNPLEAGLESTCRLEGEYLGKEALGRVRFNGIRKKLVYFHMNEYVSKWKFEFDNYDRTVQILTFV